MLVVGSVAFDTLHNSLGTHKRVLGGSATYASLAAALFTEVRLVGVVGRDFPDSAVAMLRAHGVDVEGLEIADGDTFHWEGRYSDDLTSRETLATELNVFADFQPKIPAAARAAKYLMLGNIHPALQLDVLDQVDGPVLSLADTMNFWIDGELETLKKLLARVDTIVINDEEARQLSGKHAITDVADELHGFGPKLLVIKRGEHGASLFAEAGPFVAPAFPIAAVDPTGAGDTFAGALLGYIASQDDISPATVRRAVIYGTAVASFCVEGIATQRLEALTREEVEARVGKIRELVRF